MTICKAQKKSNVLHSSPWLVLSTPSNKSLWGWKSTSDQQEKTDKSCNTTVVRKICTKPQAWDTFGFRDTRQTKTMVIKTITPSTETYLVEQGFSMPTNVKTKKQNALQSKYICSALANPQPGYEKLMELKN